MTRILRHPRVQQTINHPHVRKVVNRKTIIWFTVIKLVIYILTASFFAFNAINAKAAKGIDSSITQVKSADSGMIYYLNHASGQKKGYPSIRAFQSYGHTKSQVKTVSRVTLSKWQDARFIRVKDGSTIYYIKDNLKAAVSSKSVLDDLGYSEDLLMVVSPADFLSYKTVSQDKIGLKNTNSTNDKRNKVTKNSATNSNKISNTKKEVGGDDSLLIGNKLSVELDDSESQEFLVANSVRNLVAKYEFRTANEAVNVRGLLLNLNGIHSAAFIKKITVEIPERNLSYQASFNNRLASANFGPDYVTIPAKSHLTVEVYLDLNDFSALNNTIGFVLPQGENILTDVSVGGHFPVTTRSYKLANGGGLLGALKVEEQKLSQANLIFGSTDSTVGRFKLAETTGAEDLVIKQITFTNRGAIPSGAISDFELKDNFSNILGTATLSADNKVVIRNINYKIKKSQVRTFTLHGTIGGSENYTSNFDLSEIIASGLSYGYNVAADITNDDSAYGITRLNVAVESVDLITTNKATARQSGTVIGNFRLKNGSQSLKVEEIKLVFGKNSSAPQIVDNLYLVNYETGEVLDAKPVTNPVFNLHNMPIKANQTVKLAIVTTLPESAGNNDWYWINFDAVSYRYQNDALYRDTVNVEGEVFYASLASLSAFRNETQPAKELNIVRGQKQAKVASFILEAADSADAIIKNIAFKQGSETPNRMLAATGFSNVKLVIGSETKSKTIASPNSDNYAFGNVNYKLRAGKKVEVKVYADVSKNASVNEIQLAINNIHAYNANNNLPAQISDFDVNSNPVRIGSLSGTVEVVASGKYRPGVKNNLLGSFEVRNTGAEPLTLKTITLATRGQKLSGSAGFSNLRLIKGGSTTRLGSVSSPVSEVNKISLGNTKVDAGSSVTIEVRIDAKNSAPSNRTEIFINQIDIRGVNSQLSTNIKGDSGQAISVDAEAGTNPSGLTLNWPTSSRRISYGFRDPAYPFISYGDHTGIDIITSQGSSVFAADSGEVIDVANNNDTSYNFITIRHANGLTTTYGHLSRVDVSVGDKVTKGQKIGLSGGKPGSIGSGPYTNGAHLHFEVTLNGELADPLAFIN